MDPISGFIALVGLLGEFASERRAGETRSFEDFVQWLIETNHEELVNLIKQSDATIISIKAILALETRAIREYLDRIDRNVAILAANYPGFAELAIAVRPSARLSTAAIQLLVDFDRTGSGRLMEFANLQHGTFLLPIDSKGGSQEIRYSGDPRFYESDIETLIESKILLLRHHDGKRVFALTPQAVELARRHQS